MAAVAVQPQPCNANYAFGGRWEMARSRDPAVAGLNTPKIQEDQFDVRPVDRVQRQGTRQCSRFKYLRRQTSLSRWQRWQAPAESQALLVSQRLNRQQLAGPARRVKAKEDPHKGREAGRQHDG